MSNNDYYGAVLALLVGFLVSAGLVGFVLSAGGYQLPAVGMAGPALVVAPPVGPVPAQAQPQAKAGSAAEVSPEAKITATYLKFTPPTIQGKVGQPLKVTYENKGVIEHDLAFPGMKADKAPSALKVVAKPGQTVTLEFTPSAKGSYEYVCTIPGHKEAGMKGTIVVSD
jgi:plastocyanin